MHARVPVLGVWVAVLALIFGYSTIHAQQDFLALAIPLAQSSQRETAVPASVTLAQAMWETGRGDHPIGQAKNYFGIKAAGVSDDSVYVGNIAIGWVWAPTKEWDGTRYVERRERFRKYNSMEDSFRDHGLLLATTPRYAKAMEAVDDPREFARRIAAAGYATSPTYARDLIRVMDADNLYQYDLPRNALELLDHSETIEVGTGDIFQIYMEVKNTGFGTWSPAAGYFLATEDKERFGANAHQELDQLVQPERVKRWAITMFAPQTPGTYKTTWEMRHGAQRIGNPVSIEVRVKPAPFPPTSWLIGGMLILAGLALGALGWFGFRSRQQKTPQLLSQHAGWNALL